eukprot:scaffold192_cov190-Pinguiococcus_pyrenoidosus.AAC.5
MLESLLAQGLERPVHVLSKPRHVAVPRLGFIEFRLAAACYAVVHCAREVGADDVNQRWRAHVARDVHAGVHPGQALMLVSTEQLISKSLLEDQLQLERRRSFHVQGHHARHSLQGVHQEASALLLRDLPEAESQTDGCVDQLELLDVAKEVDEATQEVLRRRLVDLHDVEQLKERRLRRRGFGLCYPPELRGLVP